MSLKRGMYVCMLQAKQLEVYDRPMSNNKWWVECIYQMKLELIGVVSKTKGFFRRRLKFSNYVFASPNLVGHKTHFKQITCRNTLHYSWGCQSINLRRVGINRTFTVNPRSRWFFCRWIIYGTVQSFVFNFSVTKSWVLYVLLQYLSVFGVVAL